MILPGSGLPLAVIGAGFSGTMAALHLLPRLGQRSILLCEGSERFGRGLAYGTDDAWHLLNVRAANMSAFPDRPEHFLQWLAARNADGKGDVHETAAGTFVARHVYGDYLVQLLHAAVTGSAGASRLILVPDAVVDLIPEDGAYRLVLAGGMQHRVAGAVLAMGNLRPTEPDRSRYVADPWTMPFTAGLRADAPVVIVGTGLTMVDVALHLRHAGFDGKIIALSRRGLHPRSHASTRPRPVLLLTEAERRSPARLLQRLRREIAAAARAGVTWHAVIDSLRPIASDLWRGLSFEAQQSFLRHGRPWWDVHRHRMSPPVSKAFEAMLAAGTLEINAAHLEEMAEDADGIAVRFRPRGAQECVTVMAQRVINASGGVAPDRCGNVLVSRLIERGLVRPDRHKLGLDLADDLGVIGDGGERTPHLWALGPLGTGAFWECVAVPDIRQQALHLAAGIAQDAMPGMPPQSNSGAVSAPKEDVS